VARKKKSGRTQSKGTAGTPPARVATAGSPIGGTQSSVVGPSVAVRGAVQKTFISARILSGFTDASHLEQLIGEYLATLDGTRRQRLLDDADASRRFVAALPAFQAGSAVLRPIQSQYISAIQADPLFLQVFGIRPHQFAYVDLGTLIALQPWVEPRLDPIPTTENELMSFALPNNWDVPAEVSFIAPMGPIQILTSSPSFGGLRMEFDAATATVKLGAPKHLNLIQVIHFGGRYYLINGYHRVTDALAANVHELPALVTQAMSLQDVQLPGMGPFNAAYVQGLPRPPLVSDFTTAASIAAKMRERRYGILVDVTIKPLMIGI
jgi:hypothetical protein